MNTIAQFQISTPFFYRRIGPTGKNLQINSKMAMKVKVSVSHPIVSKSLRLHGLQLSVHGILWARRLEWLPFPSPGDLSKPDIESESPTLQVDPLPSEPPGKPKMAIAILKTNKQKKNLTKYMMLTSDNHETAVSLSGN